MSKKILFPVRSRSECYSDAIKEKLEVICQKRTSPSWRCAWSLCLIQNFCKRAYRNLTIYSIYSTPRYNSGNYISKYVYASDEIKSMREAKSKTHRCQSIVILRWSFGMGEARMLLQTFDGFTVSKAG